MTDRRPTIAIVGGGFSGAAVAYHLARGGVDAAIVVFEPRARLGGGLAYGGDDPVHRVNVPASRMSLLPDDETHFARWLEASGELARDPAARVGDEAYPRRREFGRYVEAALRTFVASGAVRHVRASVETLQKEGDGWRVRASGGANVHADLAVIATTHPPVRLPPELAEWRDNPQLVADPLADNALREVAPSERVLIVGAGLTAADLVAALDAHGHFGPIVMISRRGLRSRGHPAAVYPAEGDFVSRPARKATELLADVRRAVREADLGGRSWHPVFDALRVQGGEIWRALEPDARRRVARHLRPYWDVHRFRIAPQIDAVLDRKLKDGSLQLLRARLGAVRRNGESFVAELRDARKRTVAERAFDRIVVATGPAHSDILRTQAFLGALAEEGALVLDATRLGLKTSLDARAIGAAGRPDFTLFVAGPLARGTFGELMGLPQVSNYAQFVAERISAALGVVARREEAVS